MIDQCKYEVTIQETNMDTGQEILKTREKIDLSKFRSTFVNKIVNEDVKYDIIQARMRKEARQIKDMLPQNKGGQKTVVVDNSPDGKLQ